MKNKEIESTALSMWANGSTVQEIATATGASVVRVGRILCAQGVTQDPGGDSRARDLERNQERRQAQEEGG